MEYFGAVCGYIDHRTRVPFTQGTYYASGHDYIA
jgi:hypothetical protein